MIRGIGCDLPVAHLTVLPSQPWKECDTTGFLRSTGCNAYLLFQPVNQFLEPVYLGHPLVVFIQPGFGKQKIMEFKIVLKARALFCSLCEDVCQDQ